MKQIESIRNTLQKNIGKKVMLRCVKGRKRYIINCCTIENVYPGIFVVKTKDPHTDRDKMLSFSYCDILTHTIELRLYNDENVS